MRLYLAEGQPDGDAVERVLDAFGPWGAKCSAAALEVTQVLKRAHLAGANSRAEKAAELLGRFGTRGLSELVELANDGHDGLRRLGYEGLGVALIEEAEIPAALTTAIETVLAKGLEDSSPAVVAAALRGFRFFGALPEEQLPRLTGMLRSDSNSIRREALALLERLGTDARALIPELIAVVGDGDIDLSLRASIARSLARTEPVDPGVARALHALLEVEALDEDSKIAVLDGIGFLSGDLVESSMERILALVTDDPEPRIRLAAVRVLGVHGAGLPEVVLVLQQLLYGEPVADDDLRIEAAATLAGNGVRAGSVLAQLAVSLRGKRESVVRALRALADLGANAAPAKPILLEKLEDSDPLIQALSAAVCASIGVDPEALAKRLASIPLIVDDEAAVETIRALRSMIGNLRAAMVLLRWTTARSTTARIAAIEALGALEGSNQVFDKTIRDLFQDPDQRVRQAAMKTIIEIEHRVEEDLAERRALRDADQTSDLQETPVR